MEFGVFDHLDRYDGQLSGQFAFGDLTPAEFTRSVELFASTWSRR